jgi:MFS family permease
MPLRGLASLGAGLMSLFLIVAVIIPLKVVLLGAFGLLGIGMGLLNFALFTQMQDMTPDEYKGRVFGVTGSVDMAVMMGAMGVAAIAADRAGVSSIYLIAAICLSVSALWAWFVRAEPNSHDELPNGFKQGLFGLRIRA